MINFYDELHSLIQQIPENCFSTPKNLAEAMGDIKAYKAIIETISHPDFIEESKKIIMNVATSFNSFKTDKPLLKLAKLQEKMAEQISQNDTLSSYERFGGVDVSYNGNNAYAACVVIDEELRILEEHVKQCTVDFPYISGYLSFREAPSMISVASDADFDVLLVDGHGLAHPRSCGLASYIGVKINKPTIGVAKRLMKHNHIRTSDLSIIYENDVVGSVINTGEKTIFVSVGNMISLSTSQIIIKKLCGATQYPVPLQLAHELTMKHKTRFSF